MDKKRKASELDDDNIFEPAAVTKGIDSPIDSPNNGTDSPGSTESAKSPCLNTSPDASLDLDLSLEAGSLDNSKPGTTQRSCIHCNTAGPTRWRIHGGRRSKKYLCIDCWNQNQCCLNCETTETTSWYKYDKGYLCLDCRKYYKTTNAHRPGSADRVGKLASASGMSSFEQSEGKGVENVLEREYQLYPSLLMTGPDLPSQQQQLVDGQIDPSVFKHVFFIVRESETSLNERARTALASGLIAIRLVWENHLLPMSQRTSRDEPLYHKIPIHGPSSTVHTNQLVSLSNTLDAQQAADTAIVISGPDGISSNHEELARYFMRFQHNNTIYLFVQGKLWLKTGSRDMARELLAYISAATLTSSRATITQPSAAAIKPLSTTKVSESTVEATHTVSDLAHNIRMINAAKHLASKANCLDLPFLTFQRNMHQKLNIGQGSRDTLQQVNRDYFANDQLWELFQTLLLEATSGEATKYSIATAKRQKPTNARSST